MGGSNQILGATWLQGKRDPSRGEVAMSEHMKFWQLASVCRGQPQIPLATASHRAEWHEYAEWYEQLDKLIRAQDRVKLDYELPDDYVRAVLQDCALTYFEGDDGWLRSYRHAPGDRELSALQTFDKYGGPALEDAQEFGAVEYPVKKPSA